MIYLTKLAFRNIHRNRRRSILAITSVTIALLAVTFFRGFAGGMIKSIVKNSTKNETGHIRITTKEFKAKSRFFPVTANISNPQDIIQQIQSNETIQSKISIITERVTFGVLLSNEGNNKNVVALAGDPEIEKNLLMLQNSLRDDGRYIENERETIIGAKIASALHLKTGSTLKVMTQGSDYALHLRKFTVVGIFETGLNILDDKFFQIPTSDAKKLLRMGDGIQQIIIMLKDYRDAEVIADQIALMLNDDNIAVDAWSKHGDWAQMVHMAGAIYNYIYFFIAFLGAFIITNIMMMVVLERRKEIGILKSMGVAKREILLLFLIEGTILGLIGSCIGIVFGLCINIWFAINGFDMSAMMGSFNFPIDNILYFDISLLSVINMMFIGVIVSSLVSMLPAWRASRMNPVEAIKSI